MRQKWKRLGGLEVSKMDDIKITTIKDFPDNIILLLSGKINLDKLDEEVKMKKIVWAKIENE